jgi:hypothetical protein
LIWQNGNDRAKVFLRSNGYSDFDFMVRDSKTSMLCPIDFRLSMDDLEPEEINEDTIPFVSQETSGDDIDSATVDLLSVEDYLRDETVTTKHSSTVEFENKVIFRLCQIVTLKDATLIKY